VRILNVENKKEKIIWCRLWHEEISTSGNPFHTYCVGGFQITLWNSQNWICWGDFIPCPH